jgi:hypothetical protein
MGTELRNALVNNLLRGQSLNFNGVASGPATSSVWIALLTTLPTNGSGGVEVTGGGYSRIQMVSSLSSWVAPSNGWTSNALPLRFSASTSPWSEVVGSAAFTAASGGTLLLYGPLAPPKVIEPGMAAQIFLPGTLILGIDI